MEHIAAILLIVACSEVECRELPATTAVFETVEDCEQQLGPAVSAYVTKHPQIVAECVFVDPALDEPDAHLVWDIAPDGTLHASIEGGNVMVASGRNRLQKDFVAQE